MPDVRPARHILMNTAAPLNPSEPELSPSRTPVWLIGSQAALMVSLWVSLGTGRTFSNAAVHGGIVVLASAFSVAGIVHFESERRRPLPIVLVFVVASLINILSWLCLPMLPE